MDSNNDGSKWSRRAWIGGGLTLLGTFLGFGIYRRRAANKTSARGKREAVVKNSANEKLQRVANVVRPSEEHWVGDGFLVSTIFSPQRLDPQLLSPFVLMDHAAPRTFDSARSRRGVREHPHRGFETVTFAYAGEIDHRDSSGGGGTIGAGDVQWMTAASGVVHEEMHSQAFTEKGGLFEMIQLWVNLPAASKMTPPRYQSIKRDTLVKFRQGDAVGRLVAGPLAGARGPANTHSPITVFDLSFEQDGVSEFELEAGTTTLVFLSRGSGTAQRTTEISARDLLVLDRNTSGRVRLEAKAGSHALVLNGKPLGEPVVAQGPFVMNTQEQINQAFHDYRSGKMGHLNSVEWKQGG